MSTAPDSTSPDAAPGRNLLPLMVLGWAWVAVPFAYGLYRLLIRIPNLFGG